MEINKIIDQIEEWMGEDNTHTSAFVICTSKSQTDKSPNVHAYVDGKKNDALQAIAYTAYENPEAEELLTRVMAIVKMLHQEDEDQTQNTTRKEDNHAS